MSMTSRYNIDAHQIEQMELTITMTMKVAEWRALRVRAVQESGYEATHVVKTIRQALDHLDEMAGKNFAYKADQ